MTLKSETSPCVLIGDLIGSRHAPDRGDLHARLVAALRAVDAEVPSRHGLRVTVGDEFQGSYDRLGAALDVALRVRLELLPDADVRCGIGRGAVVVLDARRGIEDGPGWWAARDAIEEVERQADRAPTRWLRTRVRDAASPTDSANPADAAARGEVTAANAALLCRDHVVGSLSDRSLRLLRGLMDPDTTQAALAAAEGISASAVSQRVRSDGIGAVLAAQELLVGLP